MEPPGYTNGCRDWRGWLRARIRGRPGRFLPGSRERGAAGRKSGFTAPDFWEGMAGAAKAGPGISKKKGGSGAENSKKRADRLVKIEKKERVPG
jgi:hypothetical protein